MIVLYDGHWSYRHIRVLLLSRVVLYAWVKQAITLSPRQLYLQCE